MLPHLNKGDPMKKEQERQFHFGASVQLSTIPISRAHTRYPAHCLWINETKIQKAGLSIDLRMIPGNVNIRWTPMHLWAEHLIICIACVMNI